MTSNFIALKKSRILGFNVKMIQIGLVFSLFFISTFGLYAQRSTSIGSAQTYNSSGAAVVRVARVDDTHIVEFYKDGANSSLSPLYARVGLVNPTTKAISYGTATLVESEINLRNTILGLNSSQVVVAYERTVNSNDTGIARILTINTSTNSITVGTAYSFYNASIDAAFSHTPISMAKLSDTRFAICFADDASDNGQVVIGIASGTALSFGSAQEWSTGDVHNFWIDSLGSSKVVISFEDDGSSSDPGKVIVGDVSGTSVSFGSEYTFYDNSSSSSVSYTALKTIKNNKFVVAYTRDFDNLGYAVVGTVSGTTVSFGTQTLLNSESSSAGPRDVTICYANGPTQSDDEVAIAFNTGGNDTCFIVLAAVSGTNITTSSSEFLSTEGDDSWITNLDANTLVVSYINDDNLDLGESKVIVLSPSMAISCSMTASITSQTNAACNSSSTGSLTVTQSSGTANFDYSWSNGATTSNSSSSTNTITNLYAGTYTVTITDHNGCTAVASSSITEPSILNASATVSSALDCNGDSDGQTSASGSGGTAPYTYSWNTGGTSSLETGLVAGTYSVTITDNNGCTDSASVTLTQPTALVASAAVSSTLDCNGDGDGQASASATGGTAPYTYSWNDGQTAATATSMFAGNYYVTITDNNGCTDSASVTLTQPSAFVASAAVSSALDCNGDSDGQTIASASGGTAPYTYSWNTGGTSSLETGLVAGSYYVTITDNNGCTDSTSVTLTQPTALVASAAVSSTLECNGDSDGQTIASASGGTAPYTYSWNTGGTSSLETGLGAGTYSVTITDNNGCTDSASVTLTQPTALVASAAVSSALNCNGDSDGQTSASASGGTAPYTYSWNTGGTSASETSLSAGSYYVTITDNNGCTDSASVTLTQPTSLVASISSQSNVTTNGGSDGSSTAQGSGGTAPYTYLWSNGATTSSVTNLIAGTYTVSITDNNGCGPATTTAIITEPAAQVAVSIGTQTNVSCNGLSDGTLTATASSGTSPYTYSWSNGATTATATGLFAGTYTITVTDAASSTATASATISQPSVLSASSTSSSNVSCNGGTNGSASTSATGGTSPYTYSWSNGATTSSATNLSAAIYTVTITDNNGCTTTDFTYVTEPSALVAFVTIDSNATCNGNFDGGATSSATGGTAPYTYLWSNSATTASITGVLAGTYTVTVTDNNGCTNSTSGTVTEPSSLIASVVIDSNATCNGISDGGATSSATGGTAPYTYLWSNSATTASITGVLAGTYTVTITDNNGCTNSTSGTVTEPTSLVASISSQSNVTTNGGSDGSSTAQGSGGTAPYTYLWSNGATTSSVTNLIAGTYTVSITDNNGCGPATTTAIITEPAAQVAVSIGTQTNVSCNGLSDGTLTATASSGTSPYTYSWSNGATTATATGLFAGTYTITVTDAASSTATASATISQPSVLSASSTSSSNVSCNGGTNGSASTSATGGTSPYTYSWSNGATTSSATNLSAGTYTVTITDNNGCTTTDLTTISQPTALVASVVIDSNVTCNGISDGGATSSATGGTAPYTYLWSNSATTASITGVLAGTYTVTVTDNNGCTNSTSGTVTEPSSLIASVVIDSNATCNGNFDGGATSSATGGTAPYTYLWSNSATTASITGVLAGTYTVTITDNNGCTNSTSGTVTEPTSLGASISSQSNVTSNGGSDGSATVQGSGGTAPYTYLWSNGATTSSVTNLMAGTYTVSITDNNGCGPATTTANITQPVAMIVNATVANNVSCNGLSDGGLIASASGGTTPYTYVWNTGSTTASVTGLFAGVYTVTVTDNNGITGTDNATITQPTVLTINLVNNVSTTCSGNNGSLKVAGAGGTPSYNYLWSNATVGDSISNLLVGSYTVTISDNNSCTASASYSIVKDFSSCTPVANLRTHFIQDTSAVFRWDTAGQNAQIYKIVWKVAGTSSWSNVVIKHVPNGYFPVNNLLPNTKYLWSVMLKTKSGDWTGLAKVQRFQTLPNSCNIPTGMTVGPIQPNQAKLNWTAQAGSNEYRVRYKETSSSTWNSAVISNGNNFYWITGLNFSSSYEWQVKSVCEYGNTSGTKWSVADTFVTPSLSPFQANTLGGIIQNPIQMEVYPNPNEGDFKVRVQELDSKQVRLQLFDLTGALIKESNWNNEFEQKTVEFGYSGIEKGVYLIKLSTDKNNSFKRVIIQ